MADDNFSLEDLQDKLKNSMPEKSEPLDDSSDEDNSSEQQSAPVLDERATLLAKLNQFTGKTPVQARMNTSDAINTLMGNQNQQLKEAIDRRNRIQFIANMGRAGDTINHALTPLVDHSKDNNTFYQDLAKQAEQPVSDLGTKQKLHSQVLENSIIGEQLKNKSESNDATSAISRASQSVFKKAAQQAGLDISKIGDIDTISSANLDKMLPGIENMANRSLQRDAMSQNKQAASDQKAVQKQSQSLSQTQQLLESARGNPEVGQALKDRYAASKALTLINRYPDTDKMEPAQVKLLVAEVAKIAQGGAPTMGEMEALTPNTLSSKLSSVYQKLMNEPTPANAGKFIDKYKDYLNDLNTNAQNVVKEKFGRVIETRKKDLGDDNYNNLKEQYLTPFGVNDNKVHPQDDEAIKWAKANPTDPRAAVILKANGAQ